MKLKYVAIFLVLLCCLMGAVSAADDVSTDVVSDSVDDVAVDAVEDEISDSSSIDEIEQTVSDDASIEEIDEDIKTDEISNILKDYNMHDFIYVNISSDNDDDEEYIDGQSWETAYGGIFALSHAIDNLNDGGSIYLADGTYSREINDPKNVTFIGQSKNTILSITSPVVYSGASYATYTFINATIIGDDFGINSKFINCSFSNYITIEKTIQDYLDQGIMTQVQLDESGDAKTYFMSFDNCEFKNINSENSIITLYRYAQAKFTNCTFEDIVADSIVGKNGDFIDQDGKFTYMIVNSPTVTLRVLQTFPAILRF